MRVAAVAIAAGLCLVACEDDSVGSLAIPPRAQPVPQTSPGLIVEPDIGSPEPDIEPQPALVPQGGAAATPIAPQGPLPFAGKWMMLGFEDPVAVYLTGGSLNYGCVTGIEALNAVYFNQGDTEIGDRTLCGNVSIYSFSSDPWRVQFLLDLPDVSGGITYGADVYVSPEGDRMMGWFSPRGLPSSDEDWITTWLPEEAFDPRALPELDYTNLRGRYDLRPANDAPDAGGDVYHLELRGPRELRGDFGVFWPTEYSWDANQALLTVGPVSPTMPGKPTQLAIWFSYAGLRVDVTVPGEGTTRYLEVE